MAHPVSGQPWAQARPQPPAPVPPEPAQPAPTPTPARDAPDAAVPWARQPAGRRPPIHRSRQIVRDLPDWEPLPPGEILVQRPRRT